MAEYKYTVEYFQRNGLYESIFHQERVLRPDQASTFAYAFLRNRVPKNVVSIGCGLGVLEALFDHMGIPCVGIDGCAGLKNVYQGENLVNERLCDVLVTRPDLFKQADTLIFSESMEHIPLDQSRKAIVLFTGRLIITNNLLYHPIGRQGEHITAIDDRVYDALEILYGKAIFRCGSHLVIDKRESNKK